MSNYGKDTDTKEMVSQELQEQLPKLLDQYSKRDTGDLAQQVIDLVNDTRTAFDDSGVLVPLSEELEEVFAPSRDTYKTSKTFLALNHPDYRILGDNMIAIGAEANTGKTSLMTALAIDLLQQNPDMCALIYSLDDGGTMTRKRIVGQMLGKDLMWSHNIQKSMVGKEDRKTLGRMYVRDSIQIRDIEREARKVIAKSECKSIYIGIDYLQIIPVSANGSGGMREGYNEAVKILKELHKSLAPEGCILVLLSQLNRLSKGEHSDSMNRFRETSEIENQADVAMLMFQKNPKEENDRKVLIKILKNKKGSRGRWWGSKLLEGRKLDTFIRYTPPIKDKKEPAENKAAEKNNKKNSILKMIEPEQGILL